MSLEEAEERGKAREDYKKWVDMEEVSWRQKSRETWLKHRVLSQNDQFS